MSSNLIMTPNFISKVGGTGNTNVSPGSQLIGERQTQVGEDRLSMIRIASRFKSWALGHFLV